MLCIVARAHAAPRARPATRAGRELAAIIDAHDMRASCLISARRAGRHFPFIHDIQQEMMPPAPPTPLLRAEMIADRGECRMMSENKEQSSQVMRYTHERRPFATALSRALFYLTRLYSLMWRWLDDILVMRASVPPQYYRYCKRCLLQATDDCLAN